MQSGFRLLLQQSESDVVAFSRSSAMERISILDAARREMNFVNGLSCAIHVQAPFARPGLDSLACALGPLSKRCKGSPS